MPGGRFVSFRFAEYVAQLPVQAPEVQCGVEDIKVFKDINDDEYIRCLVTLYKTYTKAC